MLRLLVGAVVIVVVGATSDPMAAEGQVKEHYDPDDHLYLQARLDGHRPSGPVVARTLHSKIGNGPDIAAQDEIIRDTYSPTYYEPLWVLDYRFLKSGGRKYVRGPGGQILILPRSYGQGEKGDDARDYDSLIEHLRLKMLAEHKKKEHGNEHEREHGNEHEREHEQRHRQDEHVEYQHY